MNILASISSWFIRGSDNTEGSSLLFGRKSVAGPYATPTTSMQLSAYYACIRNISEDVGKLPIKVIDRKREGGKVVQESIPLSKIFSLRPNPLMTPMTFKEVITAHALGWGNGYAEIVRNALGQVVEMYPLHPSRVFVKTETSGSKVYYEVIQLDGNIMRFESQDILHIKGLGGDGLVGYSVCKFAAESLGTALATQEFGGAFFGNGSQLGGYLEHPNTMSKEAQDRLKKSLEENHKGARNAYKTAVLEEGMKWNAATIPPKDAQFIEMRNFQVVDVARWFRMPPHKIQDLSRATFSNIEEQNIDYVNDTLTPWLTRWEEELKIKAITIQNRYARFQVQELLRGNQKGRAEYYRIMANLGVLSPNDIRQAEDLDPIANPAADLYFMQSNMATLENIATSTKTVETVETDNAEEAKAIVDSMPLIKDAIYRVNTKERKALSRGKQLGENFYSKQKEFLIGSITPIFEAFGAGDKTDRICKVAEDYYNNSIMENPKIIDNQFLIEKIQAVLND